MHVLEYFQVHRITLHTSYIIKAYKVIDKNIVS